MGVPGLDLGKIDGFTQEEIDQLNNVDSYTKILEQEEAEKKKMIGGK